MSFQQKYLQKEDRLKIKLNDYKRVNFQDNAKKFNQLQSLKQVTHYHLESNFNDLFQLSK